MSKCLGFGEKYSQMKQWQVCDVRKPLVQVVTMFVNATHKWAD